MEREKLKPIAENYFPDIIGTNLGYAVEGYVWETHVPMTEEGKIVSGFWEERKGPEVRSPAFARGYGAASRGRIRRLRRLHGLGEKGEGRRAEGGFYRAKALRMTENEIGKIVVDAAVEVLGIFLRNKGQDV